MNPSLVDPSSGGFELCLRGYMKLGIALHKPHFAAAALCAVVLLFPTSSFGQASDSIIVGTVTDITGAGVPSANIIALNKDTGVKYPTVTGTAGEYRINNVPIGRYDVSATAPGFAPATVTGADLQ